jgi:DNA-binding PadR family transcriptional regulator
MSGVRLTGPTITVLRALAHEPSRWQHGYELMAETGLKSGSLYPILIRLADRGVLDATWEQPSPNGRPPRHCYRLSAAGRRFVHDLDAAPERARARLQAAR